MVQSRTLYETNPSVPTKPLREGEAYNLGDLMPATPSSALASDPMTGRYKGKEKAIASESPRYQKPSFVANGSQYGHQERSNYTEMNPEYRFEGLRPPPTEQVPGIINSKRMTFFQSFFLTCIPGTKCTSFLPMSIVFCTAGKKGVKWTSLHINFLSN
jgi:hypothetical protein